MVLITGASAGIGRAAALAFVSRGARVAALARREERLQELFEQAGGSSRLTPLVADVSDGESMRVVAARVMSEIGVPDVIVANAGIGLDALFTETTDESLRRVLDVNVIGTVRTVRPFLPAMIQRNSGRILFVSSVVGKRGIPHYSAYCASKFALHGMAEALRGELWGTGVSVGIVCPSSTDTEFQDRLLRQGPRQRRVRPRQHSAASVARAIVKMSRSRRREMVISAEGKLLAWSNALVPGLVDRVIGRLMGGRSTE